MGQTSTLILLPQTVFGTDATVVGDKQPAASYYVSGKTMQTFTWKLSGVLATISFQATLAEDPSEEDWFTVYNLVCTGGNGNGGTDLNQNINFFYINTNIKIYFPNNHFKDGLWYLNNNNIKCFAFIRDPIDRFISGYKFVMKRNDFIFNKYDDINLFIQNNKNVVENIIFRPQVTWLNGDTNNTFLIQYNKINNYNNLLYFLKRFSLSIFLFNFCFPATAFFADPDVLAFLGVQFFYFSFGIHGVLL